MKEMDAERQARAGGASEENSRTQFQAAAFSIIIAPPRAHHPEGFAGKCR